MNDENQITAGACETAEEWTKRLLEEVRVGPDFLSRCEEAGHVAYTLAGLSKVRRQHPFVALPLGDLLRAMAEVAKVPLVGLLQWFGVGSADHPTAATAENAARLAQQIGHPEMEADAVVRYAYAKAQGFASIPLLAAARREQETTEDDLTACLVALDQIESGYPPALREEAMRIREAIRRVYQRPQP